ncbi:tyrosine-type recombinase/integrase [Crossiella sp. SN42]|uniref:tyrosine-type recombinase/integrase n=1 Tax=Crossiella sp. SN42 TaxID=2944808 RepID=UPI00207CF096|nr:tyrosine-type recombinase/integrase [Crossiella sp. SN42]MCO1575332.1 tyrosine-type recombinase/integrase [Crossiella sp. SN42]
MTTRTASKTSKTSKARSSSRPKKRKNHQSPASKAAPGHGWVELKDSGNYAGRYSDPTTGRKPSKTFQTVAEADAWQIAMRHELHGTYAAVGIKLPTFRRGAPDFKDFWPTWLDNHPTESVATRRTYRDNAKMLEKFFGEMRMDLITEDDVRRWLREAREAHKPDGTRKWADSTLNTRWKVLKQILAAAAKAELRHGNPCDDLKAPIPEDKPFRVLTEQELCLVLVYLPQWLWLAALIAYDTGLRAGEVLGLRWARLELDALGREVVTVAEVMQCNNTLRHYPKGKKVATIPLTARVAEALREFRGTGVNRKSFHETVFVDPNGKPVTYDRLKAEWNRAVKKAGLAGHDNQKPTFHDLRHSFATNLARANVPFYAIQAMMRHAKADHTMRYIHAAGGDVLRSYLDQMHALPSAPASTAPEDLRTLIEPSTAMVAPVQRPREDGTRAESRRPGDRRTAANNNPGRGVRRGAAGARGPARRAAVKVAGRR